MSQIFEEFEAAELPYNEARAEAERLGAGNNKIARVSVSPRYPLKVGSRILHHTRGELRPNNATLWLHADFLRDTEAGELLELLGEDFERIGGKPCIYVDEVNVKTLYLPSVQEDGMFQKQTGLDNLRLYVNFEGGSDVVIEYMGQKLLRGSQFKVLITGEKARSPDVYEVLDKIEDYKPSRQSR